MTAITEKIAVLKREKNAVILAHTYQPGAVQDLADYVGDSYGLSVRASSTDADVIIFCGVMFMAETAAILNPAKTVIIPEPRAGCPMADMITPARLQRLKDENPGRTVICYVNSTAGIKAMSDICCTSSNAETIVRKLPENEPVIFIPDKHLGDFVRERTGRDMVLWEGFCPTHVRITPDMVRAARSAHPEAEVMIHPEAPRASRELADHVLSTGGMCTAAAQSDCREFIVATETGILHTLAKRNPMKRFYPVSDTVLCPNMKHGSPESTLAALEERGGETVAVPPDIARRAEGSLRRMLEMSA